MKYLLDYTTVLMVAYTLLKKLTTFNKLPQTNTTASVSIVNNMFLILIVQVAVVDAI